MELFTILATCSALTFGTGSPVEQAYPYTKEECQQAASEYKGMLTKVKLNFISVFVKPLISAVLCGLTASLTYSLLMKLLVAKLGEESVKLVMISSIFSISLAALVFAVCILLLRGIVKDDILSLPKGEKIAKVLEKYKLLG